MADHWGTTHYAALAGVLAAPVTIAGAVAPWASTALAAGLDGSYPALFTVLAVLIGLAAIPVVGGSRPPGADATIPTVGPAGRDATRVIH